MALSTWVIGSHPSIPDTSITVTANGVAQVVSIDQGGYYVDDQNGSLSLCHQLEDALSSHQELEDADVTVSLCRDRKVRVTSDVAFQATFSDNTVQTVLGLPSMSLAQTTHTGSTCPYVWSPNRREWSPNRAGSHGRYVYDTAIGSSGSGRTITTTNNWYRTNSFTWNHVPVERVWPSGEGPGSYFHFFHNVLRNAYRVKVYRELTDDETSTTAVSFSSALGPYVLRVSGQMGWDYERENRAYDRLSVVTMDVQGCPEYD